MTKWANRVALVCILAGSAHAAEVRVDGIPPVQLHLADGRKVTAALVRNERDASVAPGGQAVRVGEYRFAYLDGMRMRYIDVPADEARELTELSARFANRDRRYTVLRTTAGYSAGTPTALVLNVTGDGRLARYSDLPASQQDQLLPEHERGNPLHLRVKYTFSDAEREPNPRTGQTDPHGRIVLGSDGKVAYTNYEKEVPVMERTRGDNRPRMAGEFPSVEEAVAAARGNPPDTSRLRFAADFGPQFDGPATTGTARRNQLMPLIPIAVVHHPVSKQAFVAALPPDLLQAYRRGEVGPERLLLIPPTALRYVPQKSDWNAIIDDYLDLRATGRDVERIFVANRREPGAREGTQAMTLNSLAMFRDDGFDRTLGNLRDSVPRSLLDMNPRGDSDDCSSGFGRLGRR